MGGQIGLLKDPNELLQKYLPDYTFSKTLNAAPLQHTFMCAAPDEGQLVCKFIRGDFGSGQHAEEVLKRMNGIHERFDLVKHPNVLTLDFRRISESSSGGFKSSIYFTLRQFVYKSLKQKLQEKIPRMQMSEKKWFTFQALCGVSQIHHEAMVHGDIKPENILVTSFNQVYLTDLVSYKPSYFREGDLKAFNHYYGELDNNQRCYFAPERFRDRFDDSLKDYNKLEKSMDIFSLGCVIAEIFMDGAVLFDREKLFQYRKKVYNPRSDLEKKIPSKAIVDLIMNMVDLEPSKRPDITVCVKQWDTEVMPHSYSRVLFQLSSSFVRPRYLYSDLKISLLRKYMPSIWRTCFDSSLKPVQVSKMFKEPIERVIFEKLREDDIEDYNSVLVPSSTLFDFLAPASKEPLKLKITEDDKESMLILIHWIGAFLSTCYYPQSRRCALEMLLVIGRASDLEIRLQYILPYVFKMFDDKQSKVQAKAIEVAVMLFENLIDSSAEVYLGGTDFKVFDHYMMPHFNQMQKSHKNDQLVQVTYTKYLPILAKIGQKFTEISVMSRLAKKEQMRGNIHQHPVEREPTKEVMKHLMNESEWPSLATSTQVDSKRDISTGQKDDGAYQKEDGENQSTQVVGSSEFNPQQVEIFVNYDNEIDMLRKQFVSIISDYAVRQDTSIERLLFSRLGSLCDFFGSKFTMDNLIPLLNTCSNKKEFMIKLECLKSVTGVGIKVGKETLSQYMLLIYIQFLHDSEELVVLEIIRTLGRLLKNRLISKSALMDDYQAKGDQASHHLFDKLLPFLLHPNTWIREETLNFIEILSDYKNTKLLSKAEVYCVIGRKIRPYLKSPETANRVLFSGCSNSELLDLLRTPLSRNAFDCMVKTDPKKFEKMFNLKLTESDSYAIDVGKLKEVIAQTQRQYQNDTQMRFDFKQLDKKPSLHHKKVSKYNQYRVIRVATIEELSELRKLRDPSDADLLPKRKAVKNVGFNRDDYYLNFFEPCNQVKTSLIDAQNLGVNPKTNEVAKKTSQIDYVMQALNLLPDDESIALIDYENQRMFSVLANQSLPDEWRLQIEKLSSQVPQPSEIPSFHHQYSRTTSVEVSTGNQQFARNNDFCAPRTQIEKFRPSGRLITTLFEHENPVSSITVTDDQKMFFTSSRQDGMVHGWDTDDMLRDVTSHSRFSIKTGRVVNSINTLQGSKYFCLAGRDMQESNSSGLVEVYEMSRLVRESSAKVPGSVYKNASAPSQKLPTHSAVAFSIEHEGQGEMMNCMDTILPVSHQHLLAYSSQRGTLFLHDLRCRRSALVQEDTFDQARGLLTCMTQGQDPYQLICGSIGGYVMVYDIRFDTVSSSFKHSMKYPINSIANFKPAITSGGSQVYNRCTAKSPMALVASGGPQYELSLLDLESGNIEILMAVNELTGKDNEYQDPGVTVPSYHQESLIRDCYGWPEKSETNQTLFRRYLMHTRSLISTSQIKLTQNLDEELFKASRHRLKLVKQANESGNACRKVVVPRKCSNMLQGTLTTDYAITGGNDMRLRYWNLSNPANMSYYVNTPDNDECQYFSEIVAGGTLLVREQVSRAKTFPQINAGLLQGTNLQRQQGKLVIPNTQIELKSDSVYYSVLQGMIQQGNIEGHDLTQNMSARKYLTQSSLGDISSGVAHQFQIEAGPDKIMVYNYNGLSEWQHLNGLCANEGNATLHNSSHNDMWSQDSRQRQPQRQRTNQARGGADQNTGNLYRNQNQEPKDSMFSNDDYLYRESQNVSHSDTILDMVVLETDFQSNSGSTVYQQSQGRSSGQEGPDLVGGPLLITCGRDCTVKLWK